MMKRSKRFAYICILLAAITLPAIAWIVSRIALERKVCGLCGGHWEGCEIVFEYRSPDWLQKQLEGHVPFYDKPTEFYGSSLSPEEAAMVLRVPTWERIVFDNVSLENPFWRDVSPCHHVYHFSLSGTKVNSNGLEGIITVFPNVESLDFSGADLQDADISVLRNTRHLTSIALSDCRIHGDTVQQLHLHLKVETVEFHSRAISRETLMDFAKIPSLRYLRLFTERGVADNNITWFRKQRPDVIVNCNSGSGFFPASHRSESP